jgi:phosphoribosylaminoimidazolecarboxamide formyltransferase/IMP cyclohydrolase
MSSRLPVRRALVSVFDKQGLDRLAAALGAAGAEVVSTGATAATLEGHGLRVTRVEELTGFPELLGGRVKTLHPRVHAGLLADRGDPEHLAALQATGIAPFDLVVVNLYPFEQTVAGEGVDQALAVERIDVGGPAMVRAAAKNHAWVAVVCDPADYPLVEAAVASGGTTLAERRALAAKAFARTAAYDAAVAAWMAQQAEPGRFPAVLALGGRLVQALRYGENPHQAAAFYAVDGPQGPWGLGAAVQLAGKELSYNNLLDADAALGLVAEHPERPFAAIVKHTNPCGAAFGATLEEAYGAALDGDPVSAYGGVVGLSRPLDAATATRVAGVFTEVVVAPGFEPGALAALAGKPSLRLLQVDPARPARRLGVRSVAGGLLAQEPDAAGPGDDAAGPGDDAAGWTLQAGDPPAPGVRADLALAWSVAGHVKSNAIVLARGGRVVGVGAGQQSRVDAVRLAIAKAGARAAGAAAGSDAFFPFPDGVEELAAAGVVAVAQPGGSVRDAEVTAAAAAAGVAMYHTGRRHFRH